MSDIFVCGLGAVSPAGWGVEPLRQALVKGEPLPIQTLDRPGWDKPLRARLVPDPAKRPAFLTHPRLRRTSSITHYAAAAALEATAFAARSTSDIPRLGVIVCLQAGCVQYSYRFFAEVIADPQTASPLLFPETVFAAPASHLATLLGGASLVSTLLGDPAAFAQGLAMGAAWLSEGQVDICLVLGAEETNWLRADALWHLERPAIISGGAGAISLTRDSSLSLGVQLETITEAQTYSARNHRRQAAAAMRAQLPDQAGDWLCDGLGDSPRADAPESAAWKDWAGPRFSPKKLLGEGLMAAAAWQCVAACDALRENACQAVNVSLVGGNQQAIGVRFAKVARA